MNDRVSFVVASIFVLLVGISLHEYAHCFFTDLAGDPTPRMQGRLTLNPLAHLDPVGTILIIATSIVGFGFGWGKPAPMDPRKMRNPRWDIFISVLAGPVSNLLQAILYATIFRVLLAAGIINGLLAQVLGLGVILNILLAVFNLIPIFPLDGHWLVGQLLPPDLGQRWYLFQRRMGIFGLILLVILLDTGTGDSLFSPFINFANLLLGVRFF